MARTLDDIIDHLQRPLESKLSVDRIRREFEPFAASMRMSAGRLNAACNLFKIHYESDGPEKAEEALVDYLWHHAEGVKKPVSPQAEEAAAAIAGHPHFSARIRENFKGSTALEKGMRVTSAGLGSVLLGKAILSDLQKDDHDQNHPLMALIDGSAGAALLAAALLTRSSRATAP